MSSPNHPSDDEEAYPPVPSKLSRTLSSFVNLDELERDMCKTIFFCSLMSPYMLYIYMILYISLCL